MEVIDGVRSAGIDHAGELLRLDLGDRGALEHVHRVLAELGYAAQEVPDAEIAADLRWHRGSGVRELSWEEAQVIARRVVPPFGRRHRLRRSLAERLLDVVAAALYECFIGHPLAEASAAAALRDACSRAVEQAARALVGDELARELSDALWTEPG